MERIIIYCCLVLYVNTKLSVSSDPENVECIASIAQSQTTDLPSIILEAVHSYSSVTNGRPYSKGPTPVGSVHLGANISSSTISVDVTDSHTQKVTFAYNGSHVCSSAQLRLEKDTCWAGSTIGCFNKTNACDSVCFPATDFYKRHTLRLFNSYKSSSSIGTWTMSDYVSLYTIPNKQIMCFHGNESYKRFEHQPIEYPNLERLICPTGQRCRVTTGKYMYSSAFETFIGCEKDEAQYDGCEGGCQYLQYHRSPSGDRVRWVHMCRYCCTQDLCNNPYKCKGLECDLSSAPVEPKINSACSYKRHHITIGIIFMLLYRGVFY